MIVFGVRRGAASGDGGKIMGSMSRIAVGAALLSSIALGSPAAAATKFTFLYTPVNSWIGIFVAKDEGYLAKHGLEGDLTIAQNGSVISAALVADSAQIGGPTPTVLLQANEQGLDLVEIAGTGTYPLRTDRKSVV